LLLAQALVEVLYFPRSKFDLEKARKTVKNDRFTQGGCVSIV